MMLSDPLSVARIARARVIFRDWLQALLAMIFIACLHLPGAHSAELPSDATIRAIASEVAAALGATAAITISDRAATGAHFGTGVHLSRAELRGHLRGLTEADAARVLRFILAHELWHTRQLSIYSLDVTGLSSEQRRIYECQADVMAAHHVARSILIGLPEAATAMAAFRHLDIFAHSIGNPRIGGEHPSPEQRRSAVRLGGGRALLELVEPAGHSERQDMLRRLIDWRPNEGIVAWALRQCYRVTRAQLQAMRALSIRPISVNWSRDPNHPYVYFQIEYHNAGHNAIFVSAEIQSIAVPLANVHDIIRDTTEQIKVDTLNVEFDLAPSAAHVVTGRLEWYGDERLRPRLVFSPEDPTMLISAVPAGPASPRWPAPSSNLDGRAQQLLGDILAYVNVGSSGVRGFVAGPAVSGDHPTTRPFTGALESWIELSATEAPRISGLYYRGSVEREALAAYEAIVQDLSSIWPTQRAVTTSRNGLPRWTLQLGLAGRLEVYVWRSSTSGIYRVTLSLVVHNEQN
jgi:hypothetical protein